MGDKRPASLLVARTGSFLRHADTDTAEFLAELISQLLHADKLITEQAERIETLEAEVARLRAALAEASGAAA